MNIISREEAAAAGLKHFFTGVPCKHGHIDKRYVSSKMCFTCNDIKMAKHRLRNWKPPVDQSLYVADRAARKAAVAESEVTYHSPKPCPSGHVGLRYSRNGYCATCSREASIAKHAKNREASNARRKAHRLRDLDGARQRDREYRERNKKEVSARHVALRRKKRQTDQVFAMKHRVRSLIARSLSGFGKSTKTAAILGCTWEFFAAHIERQFLKGMTWENRHLWHIDHITPLATATTEAEVISLNHFTNLRPLWGPDNIAKNDKIQFLI